MREYVAGRRRADDRLERLGAHGPSVRQEVHRGARADGDARRRRERLGALRHRARRRRCELAAEISALLAFSAIRNNDRVGLLLFTDRVERFLAAAQGTRARAARAARACWRSTRGARDAHRDARSSTCSSVVTQARGRVPRDLRLPGRRLRADAARRGAASTTWWRSPSATRARRAAGRRARSRSKIPRPGSVGAPRRRQRRAVRRAYADAGAARRRELRRDACTATASTCSSSRPASRTRPRSCASSASGRGAWRWPEGEACVRALRPLVLRGARWLVPPLAAEIDGRATLVVEPSEGTVGDRFRRDLERSTSRPPSTWTWRRSDRGSARSWSRRRAGPRPSSRRTAGATTAGPPPFPRSRPGRSRSRRSHLRVRAGETTGELETEPVPIVVRSVLESAPENAPAEIADLKPPASMPPDYRTLYVALVLLGLLVAGAAVVWWLHRRSPAVWPRCPCPTTRSSASAAHVWVYRELQQLLERRLAEQGQRRRVLRRALAHPEDVPGRALPRRAAGADDRRGARAAAPGRGGGRRSPSTRASSSPAAIS